MNAYTKPRDESTGLPAASVANGTREVDRNLDSVEAQPHKEAAIEAISNGEPQPESTKKQQPAQAEQHEEECGKKQRKYFPLMRLQKRQNSRDGDDSQTAKDPKNKVTITLFIISCCFIIFVTPFLIFEDVAFFLKIDVTKNRARIVRKILRILFLINFVNNPFIYFATSEMFRHRLVNICQIVIPQRFQPLSLRNEDQLTRAQMQHATRRTSAYATRL